MGMKKIEEKLIEDMYKSGDKSEKALDGKNKTLSKVESLRDLKTIIELGNNIISGYRYQIELEKPVLIQKKKIKILPQSKINLLSEVKVSEEGVKVEDHSETSEEKVNRDLLKKHEKESDDKRKKRKIKRKQRKLK